MTKISCKVKVNSNDRHIQHLLTGFSTLARNRKIDLIQEICDHPSKKAPAAHHLEDAWKCHLAVVINDSIDVFYDCHDSWELDDEALEKADIYFKRTFVESKHSSFKNIYPLGLYHPVYSDFLDTFALRRAMAITDRIEKLSSCVKCLDVGNFLHFAPKVPLFDAPLSLELPPKVIFMARAWDPHSESRRDQEKRDDRAVINEMRAQVIRLLKKEFGANFIGGFAHDDYAIKHFSDCLLADPLSSKARNYFSTLKSVPICVATKGLHGSVGAKFSEYVALGKSIVSEPLGVEFPGDLRPGKNYLEFVNPEECVTQVKRLFEEPPLREQMMKANREYYQRYSSPDMLILNSIQSALKHAGQQNGL